MEGCGEIILLTASLQHRSELTESSKGAGNKQLVILEQRSHLFIDCVLVGDSRQTSHIDSSTFVRWALVMPLCIIPLPPMEDVRIACTFAHVSRLRGLRTPATIIRQSRWSRSTITRFAAQRVEVDLDGATHHLLAIQLSDGTSSFIFGIELYKAVRWIAACERVRGDVKSLAMQTV